MPFDSERFPLPRPIPEGHRRMEDFGFASPSVEAPVTDDVLRVLIEARARIEDPAHWCRDALYENGANCALGAVFRATEANTWGESEPAMDQAASVLWDALPSGYRCVAAFNNARTTTHADVLSLFDRAIAARRSEIGA